MGMSPPTTTYHLGTRDTRPTHAVLLLNPKTRLKQAHLSALHKIKYIVDRGLIFFISLLVAKERGHQALFFGGGTKHGMDEEIPRGCVVEDGSEEPHGEEEGERMRARTYIAYVSTPIPHIIFD